MASRPGAPNRRARDAVGMSAAQALAATRQQIDMIRSAGTLIPMGSANRLVMLEGGYLEILTPVAGVDTPLSRHMAGCIARNPGVHLIAFTVADAERDAGRVAAAGFDLQPTVHLRRTIEGNDGSETEVSFTVMRASVSDDPGSADATSSAGPRCRSRVGVSGLRAVPAPRSADTGTPAIHPPPTP